MPITPSLALRHNKSDRKRVIQRGIRTVIKQAGQCQPKLERTKTSSAGLIGRLSRNLLYSPKFTPATIRYVRRNIAPNQEHQNGKRNSEMV
jgi:hypothetical protein